MNFDFNLFYGYQYVVYLLSSFSFLGVSFLTLLNWVIAVSLAMSLLWFLVSAIKE